MSNYWLDQLEMWTNVKSPPINKRYYIIAHDRDDLMEIVQKMIDKSIKNKSFWYKIDDSEIITYHSSGICYTRNVEAILKTHKRGYFYCLKS